MVDDRGARRVGVDGAGLVRVAGGRVVQVSHFIVGSGTAGGT
jgi:hypothetical protein